MLPAFALCVFLYVVNMSEPTEFQSLCSGAGKHMFRLMAALNQWHFLIADACCCSSVKQAYEHVYYIYGESYKPKLFKWKAIIVTERRKDYSFISYIVGERF